MIHSKTERPKWAKWTQKEALEAAKEYGNRKDCNHYAHGLYAFLVKNGLVDEAFPKKAKLTTG